MPSHRATLKPSVLAAFCKTLGPTEHAAFIAAVQSAIGPTQQSAVRTAHVSAHQTTLESAVVKAILSAVRETHYAALDPTNRPTNVHSVGSPQFSTQHAAVFAAFVAAKQSALFATDRGPVVAPYWTPFWAAFQTAFDAANQ